MSEKGFSPDVLTSTALLHMYSRSIQIDKAEEAYGSLKRLGFRPDIQTYKSLIMAYVNAGEALMRVMELRDIKASEEIYLSLLQAFDKKGDVAGAQRIVTTMQFSGFQPTAESYTLLIQASEKSGNLTATKNNFEYMTELGYKPDDRTTSMFFSAYEKGNHLDKASSLLLQLEKDGSEPGILTYCVLVDWLGKLQLIDEAEQMLTKIGQLGEAPPLKLHASLLDMYSRVGFEKKTLQALGVLEAKKDRLEYGDFERIIQSLFKGGFFNDADRICNLMKAQGFSPSQSLQVHIMAMETYMRGSTNKKPGMN